MRRLIIVQLLAGGASIVALLSYFIAPSMPLFDDCDDQTKYPVPQHRVHVEACKKNDGFQLKSSNDQLLATATFDSNKQIWQLKARMTNGDELQLKLAGTGEYKDTVIFRICPNINCTGWKVLFSLTFTPPSHNFTLFINPAIYREV